MTFVESMDDPRLDKWLWSVRVFKTRPLATAACRAGKVLIGELEAKPGRDIHVGELVTVRVGALTRTLKVAGLPRSRVAAKQLPEFLTDLTPPAEYERAKQAGIEHLLARQRGAGRPTKKDRREMGRLFDFE
jgi:ribosome-associated heat shock protein Hsp15